jgi:hypothetical protein
VGTTNLIMAAVMASAVGSGCSWAHPGANPYRGAPTAVLDDFAMSDETRRQLRALMTARSYTDVVTITRDRITGQHVYGDLRQMHSGHGQVCHGSVDRSAWSATHEERGLVYCVGETCVVVPTICNNVSLVTRRPEEDPLQSGADEPIDISPAAGPTPPSSDAVVAQGPDSNALDFTPFADVPTSSDGSGGSGGGFSSSPIGGGSGGTLPCCDTGPAGPISPGTPPVVEPTSPVPEAPAWSLLLAGLALMGAMRQGVSSGVADKATMAGLGAVRPG